jgi:hypothetical protein
MKKTKIGSTNPKYIKDSEKETKPVVKERVLINEVKGCKIYTVKYEN